MSKLLAESSIFNQNNWESFITVARLGNMIGHPGSIYLGNSNLFAFEIIKNLVNNKQAIIKSDPLTKIGFLAISSLFSSKVFTSAGFYKLYNSKKNSIYSIAKIIQKSYENISGEKAEIIFKNKVTRNNFEVVPDDIKKEIELMVIYFFKKNFD